MKKNLVYYLSLLFMLGVCMSAKAANYDAVVAKDGSGKYTSLQAAIDAAPAGSTKPYRIFIKSGKYTEQIVIPAGKNYLELIGEDPANTIIAYGDGKGGTASFIINASDCMLKNLTLVNTQGAIGDGPQSLAVRTNGDRIVFFNCRFISGQDTVLVSKAATRVYFSKCYIDGNTDFIYGGAVGVFDDCVIYGRDRVDGSKGGYITAANTPAGQAYGLVFRNCLLPANHGITGYTLGRPWQNDSRTDNNRRAANKVVFLNSKMSSSIMPVGWSMWDKGTDTTTITYAEYNSRTFSGAPVDVKLRLGWTKQLSQELATPYLNNQNLFGNWNPFEQWKDLPAQPTENMLALNNLVARDNSGEILLQFNTSWPAAGTTFTLYRSDNGSSAFKKADDLRAAKDAATIAYQFTDKTPADGQHVLYYVAATQGKRTVVSDTLEVAADKLLPLKPQPKHK